MTVLLRPAPEGAPEAAPRPIRIGFLTPHNSRDRRAFSGTAFQAAGALERRFGAGFRRLGGHHRDARTLDRLLRRRQAAAAVRAPDLAGLDIVVGLVATSLLAGLPPGMPFLHVTDATPGFLRETYGWDVPRTADAAEAQVLARAAAGVYSSRFMAKRAARDFALAPGRTRAVPFGINLDARPGRRQAHPPAGRVELLFVGADWARKGGDIALDALAELRRDGIDAHLTLVGNVPEAAGRAPGVTVAGFLDKNRPRDLARLKALYARAHLFLLPTRGDCTPMVIAEAMAHGTPVIASDTGGVAELIGGGGAGRVLPTAAGGGDWAREIRAATTDPAAWALASDAALDRAALYSWDAWAAGIEAIVRDCLGQGDRVRAA